MGYDAVTFVINTILVINVLFGIGGWFAGEFNSAGIIEMDNQNPNISINESAFDTVANQIETNPSLGGIGTSLRNIKYIFLGIPEFIKNIMQIGDLDQDLVTIVYGSLVGLMLVIYFIFILQVVSYLRGGG